MRGGLRISRRSGLMCALATLLISVPASAVPGVTVDVAAQPAVETVAVRPGEGLAVTVWTRSTPEVRTVVVGARWEGGAQVRTFPAGEPGTPNRYDLSVDVPEGVTELEVVVGPVIPSEEALLQIDRVDLSGPGLIPGARAVIAVTPGYRGGCSCGE